MPASDPNRLSPNRGSILFVSRLTYYAGLLLGTMFGGVAVAIYYSNFGNLAEGREKAMVAAVFGVLALMSYFFAKVAHGRIAKLK